MAYSLPRSKTITELKQMLMDVFDRYDEYRNFDAMVSLFANDDFYKLHYIAKQYLNFKGE